MRDQPSPRLKNEMLQQASSFLDSIHSWLFARGGRACAHTGVTDEQKYSTDNDVMTVNKLKKFPTLITKIDVI